MTVCTSTEAGQDKGAYEAQFAQVEGGWRIVEAVVEGDDVTYRRGSDEHETGFLKLVISGVLLNEQASSPRH